jgi:hypothetical protein
MPKTVLMTVYKQYATTVYNREDLAIVDVHTTSPPEKEPITASLYWPIWRKIFTPPGNESSALDRIQVDSMLYSLAFLIRLYDDVFPDDPHTPLSYLQNFLAIPLQFSTVCVQYANYTLQNPAGLFPMAPDTLTVALPGKSADRFVSQPWTVWMFIAGCIALISSGGLVLIWIIIQDRSLPEFSGILEWDFVAKCLADAESPLQDESMELLTAGELVRRDEELRWCDSWAFAQKLKQYRVKLMDSSAAR